MKKTAVFTFFIIFNLFLSGFALAQYDLEIPDTLDEAKEMGEKAVKTGIEKLPQIVKELWEEKIMPVWEKMYDWFDDKIWTKLKDLFQKEVEKRKPIVEQELEKEAQELKEELPEVTQGLWEKFKELWDKKE